MKTFSSDRTVRCQSLAMRAMAQVGKLRLTKSKFRFVIGCFVIASSYCALAQRDVTNVIPNPIYDLKIQQILPDGPVLEHSPIDVSFAFQLIPPIGGHAPEGPLSICPANGSGDCVTYSSVIAKKMYRGTIHMAAPAAGAKSLVKLIVCRRATVGEDYGCLELSADEKPMIVFARYVVALVEFEIQHTRAHSTDTVYASLEGRVAGQRSADPDACSIQGPPTFCVPGTFQGNHQDGIFAISNIQVGPFDLIPEVDGDLTFAYAFVNYGTSKNQKDFKKTMDTISDITSFGLSAYQPQASQAWSQGNDITHKLNDLQWGGCDGPVAADTVVVLNKTLSGQVQSTLAARTEASGRFRQPSQIHETDSQDGCGGSPKYRVTWEIVRTSWNAVK
jgi:hypothetical protein